MSADNPWGAEYERDLWRLERRQKSAANLEKILRVYSVFGALMAMASVSYYTVVTSRIEFTPIQRQTVLIGGVGILVSIISALFLYIRRSSSRIQAEQSRYMVVASTFLLQWARFEKAARALLGPDTGLDDYNRSSVREVMTSLMEDGSLTSAHVVQLEEAIRFRNDLIHSGKRADTSYMKDLAKSVEDIASILESFRAGENDLALIQRRKDMQIAGKVSEAFDKHRLLLFRQKISSADQSNDELRYEIRGMFLDEGGQLHDFEEIRGSIERFGLSQKIDRWTFDAVIEALTLDDVSVAKLTMCAINLSASSWKDPAFGEYIITSLKQLPTHHVNICFEINESELVQELEKASRFSLLLKEAGCSLSIDNFGSGSSSLGFLRDLTFDYVKIDSSLIRGISEERVDYELVNSMISLVHVLGKKTIAAGVDSAATLNMLRQLDIDFLQGEAISSLERVPQQVLPRDGKLTHRHSFR